MDEQAEILDTLGLLCPVPIIRTAQKIKHLPVGAELVVLSDDAGIVEDLPAWCRSNGQEMVGIEQSGRVYRAVVRRRR